MKSKTTPENNNLHPEFKTLLDRGPESFLPHNIPLRWLDVLFDQGQLFTRSNLSPERLEECTEFMNALLTLMAGSSDIDHGFYGTDELHTNGTIYTFYLKLEKYVRNGYLKAHRHHTVINFFADSRDLELELGQNLWNNLVYFGKKPTNAQIIFLLFHQAGQA